MIFKVHNYDELLKKLGALEQLGLGYTVEKNTYNVTEFGNDIYLPPRKIHTWTIETREE